MGNFPHAFSGPLNNPQLSQALQANFLQAATEAFVGASLAVETAAREAADTALGGRLDAIEATDYATQVELEAHVNDATAAHAASAVSVNPSGLIVVSTSNVQAAIGELDTAVDARIPKSLGTAKGAMVGFSASGTPVEIPAAPGDGYGLTSDSSQPGGMKWGARSRRVLAAQAAAFVGGSLSTTPSVLTEAGVLRSTAGCGDAIFFRYAASEWTVGGVAPTFFLDTTVSVNGTAPGQTIRAYLAVVTGLGGGAGSVAITAAATVTYNDHSGLTAGMASHLLGSGLTLSDGNLYYFSIGTASGTANANNAMNITSKLYAVYPE